MDAKQRRVLVGADEKAGRDEQLLKRAGLEDAWCRRKFDPFQKWIVGARRAVALALSGEPDEAAAVGLASAAAARETNSERTRRLLGDVIQVLRPWINRPGPAELRQAVLTSPR